MPREEEKPPEQIPWAQHVKVTHDSGSSIDLKRGKDLSADIWHKDFEWSVSMNSKIMIDEYMKEDERLTKDIQEFWDAEDEKGASTNFQDRILKWLKGGSFLPAIVPGPKEWRPTRKLSKIKAKLSQYGYGNTYNEDNTYFWGDVFEFAHFETDEGEQGAVIMWQGGGDPRGNYRMPIVYMGDFEAFFDSQYEHDPNSVESFLNWNSAYENGFMWAWEKLGVFENWDEHVEDYDDRFVRQVLKAIKQDPSILLPESVEKILFRFDDFPQEIQHAVTWLMANKRREIEKALGQKLLWEDIYGK